MPVKKQKGFLAVRSFLEKRFFFYPKFILAADGSLWRFTLCCSLQWVMLLLSNLPRDLEEERTLGWGFLYRLHKHSALQCLSICSSSVMQSSACYILVIPVPPFPGLLAISCRYRIYLKEVEEPIQKL